MELDWWVQEAATHNQLPVTSPVPDLIIVTDASLLGWGAQHRRCQTGGNAQ